MFKLMSIFLLVGAFFMAGCAGKMKDADKMAAEAVFVEALGAMFDANPEMRAPAIKIATEGIDLLNGKSVVTRAGVVKWVMDQVSAMSPSGPNKHMNRVMYILLNNYLPNWEDSTLNFISDADKSLLNQLANDVLVAAE
jgi:hypothetical protein